MKRKDLTTQLVYSELMQKIVVPGEQIATSEEFMRGKNTYEEDGKIIASTTGILEIDADEMIANVKPVNPPVTLNVGDEVYGVVFDIKGPMISVQVSKVEGLEREISSETLGSLHISEISKNYVSEAGREFRIGDIIRAEVIQTNPSLQLTTAKPHLGVLQSLCMRCRGVLKKKKNYLYCSNCERKEFRKLAKDYWHNMD